MQNFSRSRRPKVLILHAYSPTNAGDGLLVELALEAVGRVTADFEYRVVASDADGFADARYIQWGLPSRLAKGPARRPAMILGTLGGGGREIRRLAHDADLIVAVGGAYLRGGSRVEAAKSWGAHYGQLSIASRFGEKAVYLPQSIGPLNGAFRRLVESKLSTISTLFVRDDKTQLELNHLPAVLRAPDMAIMKWAEEYSKPRDLGPQGPVFIARDLEAPRSYYDFLRDVAADGGYEWAIQATGGGNDDRPLTERMAGGPVRTLSSILKNDAPRVVVSTRLHGALSSLIAGFPAVHLTYERKGWSAYKDLGLDGYVLSARDATLAQVNDLVRQITKAPTDYWQQVHRSVEQIRRAQALLDARLQSALAGHLS